MWGRTTMYHYKASFKRKSVYAYNHGRPATVIFQKAGFDISMFPPDYCRLTIKRWVKAIKTQGIGAFDQDLRGSGSPRGPRKSSANLSENQLKARVAYLEAEVDFLKKLRALAKKES